MSERTVHTIPPLIPGARGEGNSGRLGRAVLGAHDGADGREVRIDGDWLGEGSGFEAYGLQTASHSKQVGEFGDDFGGDHFDRNPSALRES